MTSLEPQSRLPPVCVCIHVCVVHKYTHEPDVQAPHLNTQAHRPFYMGCPGANAYIKTHSHPFYTVSRCQRLYKNPPSIRCPGANACIKTHR